MAAADPVADFVAEVTKTLKAPKADFGSLVIGAALACIAIVLWSMSKRRPPGTLVALSASPGAARPGGVARPAGAVAVGAGNGAAARQNAPGSPNDPA